VRARLALTSACSAAFSLLVLYAIWRVGRALDEAWDEDDWLFLSCDGRGPDEGEA
jgi:hypothetical protein